MANSQLNAKHLKKNEDYYLTGGDLHLLVGEELFRVHRFFFDRESTTFRQSLNSPSPAGQPGKGSDDGTAIVIEGFTPADMELFLWVFYNPKYSLYEAKVEDWDRIFEMARAWDFPQIKALCIRELERKDIPLVDRIVLYQKHEVGADLLLPLYAELSSQELAPTREECLKLGLETTMAIFYARERLRSPISAGGKSPLPSGMDKSSISGIVKEFIEGPSSSRPKSPAFKAGGQSGSGSSPANGHANDLNKTKNNKNARGGLPGGGKTNGTSWLRSDIRGSIGEQ